MTPLWQTFETRLRECPYCWAQATEAHACNDTAPPAPGNFNLCAECGAISVFTEQDQLREATEEELEAALTQDDLMAVQTIILIEIAMRKAV
jgi:hypothetical protein